MTQNRSKDPVDAERANDGDSIPAPERADEAPESTERLSELQRRLATAPAVHASRTATNLAEKMRHRQVAEAEREARRQSLMAERARLLATYGIPIDDRANPGAWSDTSPLSRALMRWRASSDVVEEAPPKRATHPTTFAIIDILTAKQADAATSAPYRVLVDKRERITALLEELRGMDNDDHACVFLEYQNAHKFLAQVTEPPMPVTIGGRDEWSGSALRDALEKEEASTHDAIEKTDADRLAELIELLKRPRPPDAERAAIERTLDPVLAAADAAIERHRKVEERQARAGVTLHHRQDPVAALELVRALLLHALGKDQWIWFDASARMERLRDAGITHRQIAEHLKEVGYGDKSVGALKTSLHRRRKPPHRKRAPRSVASKAS